MLHKDQAICLRAVNYSETSQVVTLFSRKAGKIAAIAKGSRRPKSSFEGAIEVFSCGDIIYAPSATGKLATLTEFGQKPVFRGLRMKLFALNCALFAAELVDSFTHESDPHEELFDSFYNFLADVQHAPDKLSGLGLLVLFQLTLLSDVGTRPLLAACANCNTPFSEQWPQVHFSSTANGMVCYDCEQAFTDKIRLTNKTAKCLSSLQLIKQATPQTINEIEKLLVYHFTALLHRPPKMAKHFLTGSPLL